MSGSPPPSLAKHFEAPDDYLGEFGWVCGFSADAAFINDAADRFTGLTAAQRAHQGKTCLALYLDPGNPHIRVVDAPGVAHVAIKAPFRKSFRLLHAKIALLGFRHRVERSKCRLRLVVSTGNWTRQTLEESLDLAWRLDIPDDGVPGALDCADIKVALEMFDWLDKAFDTTLLDSGKDGVNASPRAFVWERLNACALKAQGQSRLFHNIEEPVFSQIVNRLSSPGHGVAPKRRNYLAMGSGFYEAEAQTQQLIPSRIVDRLIEGKLLAQNATVDLFVNPNACQAIATSADALATGVPAIIVRPAATPEALFGQQPRTLHAKFMFGANRMSDSNSVTSPWVYLGSGNLTDAGLMQPASKGRGNFEAGVVLHLADMRWCDKKKSGGQGEIVTHLLPLQSDKDYQDSNTLSSGEAWAPPEAAYVAPPISHMIWQPLKTGGRLQIPLDDVEVQIEVVLPSVGVCEKRGNDFLWTEPQPRQVTIRWIAEDREFTAEIPLVDQYGRIAATALPEIGLEEAWLQLEDFPMPPESDTDDEGNEIDFAADAAVAANASGKASNTSVRQMMQLIEGIAARQTELPEADWALWCNRLEQTLGQASGSAPVTYFTKLGINPLAPLYRPQFRPEFAENNDSDKGAGTKYTQTLKKIETAWKVSGLESLGGDP